MKLPCPSARGPLLVALLLATLALLGATPLESVPVHGTPPAQISREAGAGSPAFAPGVVLALPRHGAPPLAASLSPDYAMEVKSVLAELGILRLEVPAGREVETARRLEAAGLVEWAEPDYLRNTLATVPNDQLYRQHQWNLRKIQAEQAWDISTGNSDVVVAVLDTGIDASHPDLVAKLVPGYDFLNDVPEPADDSGHGTHKAGVVAATSNNGLGIAGMAWGVRVMPVKVLDSSGIGKDSVIARGIAYAADHGARVINMSFGSATVSKALDTAVQYALDKGVVLVAAAGNTAKLDNAVIYPAAYEGVVAVAATDEQDKVPDFSQHHPYVAVAAPGVKIVGPFWRGAGYGSYVSSSGTSDAAPHVSGLAALIWSVNPSLSGADVRRIILETTDDLGPKGRDEYYGTGRLNAYRALLSARPAGTLVVTPTVGAAPIPTPTPSGPTPTPAPAVPPAVLPRTVWYFAEGSTRRPFDTWLLLQNPNATAATGRVTYMKGDGSREVQEVWLPPVSRRSIYVNQVVPEAEVSIKVESDALLFAERSMYFGADGHDSVGVPAPATRWYLAEGNTQAGFDTWILLQNPLAAPANVNLAFMTPQGERKEILVGVAPTTRKSIYLNEVMPDAEVSTVVSSDQPIIVERSTYFDGTGGHGAMAANQLSRDWYLAEGRVGEGYDTWLLVLNPGASVANLRVTFMREEGPPSVGYYAVGPGRRLSVYLNHAVAPGRLGARVESDQPVAVDRSTYFAGLRGGHSVAATSSLSREWYLPEGSTRQPFAEEVAVLNPNDRVANLAVTFMRSEGTSEVMHFALNPTSRLTLNVNQLLPEEEASARVAADVPVAVERSMYFAEGRGGTSSFGIPR